MDLTKLSDDILPIKKVSDVSPSVEPCWMIEDLWQMSAVGIIGGQPKCCKSWFGLDMAVSVASQTPCLGRFMVAKKGPTLVYLAEDAIDQVRKRIAGICGVRGLSLESIDLTLITCPVLRLDMPEDQRRLRATIAMLRPALLLLDPLVRLHRLDENSSREISGLLSFIRELQREYDVAIVLTHHSGKRIQSRPGQGLRGSGDLHAFGDSNIYLTRGKNGLITVTPEHRSAATIEPFTIELKPQGDSASLFIKEKTTTDQNEEKVSSSLTTKIIDHLSHNLGPIPKAQLRTALRVNNQRLGESLQQLKAEGVLIHNDEGWTLSTPESSSLLF